ncbi:hypothetical protein BD289DRAFT_481481 [Coniella lustricola]|uniref:Uncharacterized protein n=1 Tax=Coniella lustricola TaxID=2025994 RepID=A0A2T3AC60_9PEZI|nr:hypothetical protein BD289DRAFT_481481 [Coniella lustricola]
MATAQQRYNDADDDHYRHVPVVNSVAVSGTSFPKSLRRNSKPNSKLRSQHQQQQPQQPKRHLLLFARLNKLMRPSDTASWVWSQPGIQSNGPLSPRSPASMTTTEDAFRIVHQPDTMPLYSPPTPINPRTEDECERALTEMFERSMRLSERIPPAAEIRSSGRSVEFDEVASIRTADSNRDDDESDSTVTIKTVARKVRRNIKWSNDAGMGPAAHTKPRPPPPIPAPPPSLAKISMFPPRYVQPRSQSRTSAKLVVSHLETITGSPVKDAPVSRFEPRATKPPVVATPSTPGPPRTSITDSIVRGQRSSAGSTQLHAPRLLSERALLTINTKPRIKHDGSVQNRLSPLWSSSSPTFRTHQRLPSGSSSSSEVPRLRQTSSRLQTQADRLLRESRPASRSETIGGSVYTDSDEEKIRRAVLSSATFGNARRSRERRSDDAKENVPTTPSKTRLVIESKTPDTSPQKVETVVTPTASMEFFRQSKADSSPPSDPSAYTTPSSCGDSSSATPATPHGWSARSSPTQQGRKAAARASGILKAWHDSGELKMTPSKPSPSLYFNSLSRNEPSGLDQEQVRIFPSPPPPKLPVKSSSRREPLKPVAFRLKRNALSEMSQGTVLAGSEHYHNDLVSSQTKEDGEIANAMKMLASESESESEKPDLGKRKQGAGGSYGDWFSYYAESEVVQGVSLEAKAPTDSGIYEQISSIYDMYTEF